MLKYVEYFVLYFMVVNVVQTRQQVRWFLGAMLVTAVGAGLYAYWQTLTYGIAFRVSTPFEGHPEPNTFAGYLVIILAICLATALYATATRWRLLGVGVAAFLAMPFLFTYSRGGYVAFVAMYLVVCLLSTRHRLVLVTLLVLGALVAVTMLPPTVYQRIAMTFDPRGAVQVGGMRLAASPAQRLLIWRFIFEKWQEHPFLGFGVTGVGLVDNQTALVIGELGLLGLAAYLWVRWRLLAMSFRTFRRLDDPLAKGVSLAFFASLIGLLVHSLTGNIFIIVRIMEPFWLLAALVTVLPQVVAAAGQGNALAAAVGRGVMAPSVR